MLEHFEETFKQADLITDEQITQEAKTLAGANASGVIGALKVIPKAISHVNWLELLLALGTIIIIYGFKKITTTIPSTLVALVIMSLIAIGFGLDYRPIEEIPGGIPIPNMGVFTQLISAQYHLTYLQL